MYNIDLERRQVYIAVDVAALTNSRFAVKHRNLLIYSHRPMILLIYVLIKINPSVLYYYITLLYNSPARNVLSLIEIEKARKMAMWCVGHKYPLVREFKR